VEALEEFRGEAVVACEDEIAALGREDCRCASVERGQRPMDGGLGYGATLR
jgi:hypothetical protein